MQEPLDIGCEYPTGSFTASVIYERDTKRFRVTSRFVRYTDGYTYRQVEYVTNDHHAGTDLTNAFIHAIEEFDTFACSPF